MIRKNYIDDIKWPQSVNFKRFLEYSLFLRYFRWTIEYIAGSSKGRTSLSESENFGSIPSPAANESNRNDSIFAKT